MINKIIEGDTALWQRAVLSPMAPAVHNKLLKIVEDVAERKISRSSFMR